jgi:hypothetical protein
VELATTATSAAIVAPKLNVLTPRQVDSRICTLEIKEWGSESSVGNTDIFIRSDDETKTYDELKAKGVEFSNLECLLHLHRVQVTRKPFLGWSS